MLKNFKI